MGKFLKSHTLPELTWEDTDKPNSPVSTTVTEYVAQTLPQRNPWHRCLH